METQSNNEALPDTEGGGVQMTSGSSSTKYGSSNGDRSPTEGGNTRDNTSVINGHLDPAQRKVYLIILSMCISSALLGFILILTWMLKFRPQTGIGLTNAAELANLHPLLMYIFMVSLNMYAVLIYRTHFNLPKAQLKLAHALISGTNIVMSLLGVLAMYRSHVLSNRPNFYSLHSWIGALTNLFYLTQFVAGLLFFLNFQYRASILPWHRISGAAILVLASASAITGIAELVIFQDGNDAPYARFEPITFVANFAGISVVVMTASTLYLLTASKYSRPNQNDEMPLRG